MKHFEIKDIPLDDILIHNEQSHVQNDNKYIKRLASSISKMGLLQPIYVCPADEHGKYVLLTGERYFLAYKNLNRKTITAIITRKLSETEIRQVRLAEGIQGKVSLKKKNPNSGLTATNIPSPKAHWRTITKFALSFNGYEYWGSSEKCAKIANSRRDRTLAELRTCLFFEQRRWRHFGEKPDKEAMKYIRDLIEKICKKVEG